MNYPLIKKFLPELHIKEHVQPAAIIASDLEAELAKGGVVYGEVYERYNSPLNLTYGKLTESTHSGLLIGYQPIENQEPVSREEMCEMLQRIKDRHAIHHSEINKLIERIKRNGVK